MHGGGGVEAGCRLVKDEHRRVDEELVADGHALALSARDATPCWPADEGAAAFLEAKRSDNGINSALLLCPTHTCLPLTTVPLCSRRAYMRASSPGALRSRTEQGGAAQRHGAGQAEASCVEQRLVDRQRIVQEVVLQHKANVPFNFSRQCQPIKQDGATDGDTLGAAVANGGHEGGLAGARGAH